MHFPVKTLVATCLASFTIVTSPPLSVRFAGSKEDIKLCEFYPLSSFPMYSTFSESPFCVHLTDPTGTMIGTRSVLGVYASDLKKTYERQLKAVRAREKTTGPRKEMPLAQRQAAGLETLRLILQRPAAEQGLATIPSRTLCLHETTLTMGPAGILRTTTPIATYTPGP